MLASCTTLLYTAWQCLILNILFFSLPLFLLSIYSLLSFYYSSYNLFYYFKHIFFFLTYFSSLNPALLLSSHIFSILSTHKPTHRPQGSLTSTSSPSLPTFYTYYYPFSPFSPSSTFLPYPFLFPPSHLTSYPYITYPFISDQFPTSYPFPLISFIFSPSYTITYTLSIYFLYSLISIPLTLLLFPYTIIAFTNFPHTTNPTIFFVILEISY